ncbi:acetyl-coenzyme A synthetase N-terminal domain-containing protein [Enterovibrio coralii]|nr:acetyl-coenzyme A synthetase N-terminal domain-containing protein [Enterovibrio coralii]
MSSYQDAFQRSVSDPAAFWLENAKHIDWYTPPKVALQKERTA